MSSTPKELSDIRRPDEQLFVRGDDLNLDFTITNVPATQTLSKAWFTVKQSARTADTEAVLQKVVTPTATSAGQITDTGADGTGAARFILTPTDTRLFAPGRSYLYDIQVLTSTGAVYTPQSATLPVPGKIAFADEITQAVA